MMNPREVTTHLIEIERTPDGAQWRLLHKGRPLGVVKSPLYGAAQLLLAKGLATPSDLVEVYRVEGDGSHDILGRTIVGKGARLAMSEAAG